MAAYEVLLLNTAIPQIQAAQSGDTYLVPRDIAINATAIISANSATDALRITQTGAGNAILVEDSANPDSTPFVVTATGNVGIGTNNPAQKLDVRGGSIVVDAAAAGLNPTVFFDHDNFASGTRNYIQMSRVTESMLFGVANSDRMTLDSSGNLGLGVTPSNFAVVKAFQAEYATLAGNSSVNLAVNAYFNSGWKYTAAASALLYTADSGSHKWYRSTSAQVINTDPVFDQAMTLDASGNLGIGTTSIFTNPRLSVYNGATLATGGDGGGNGVLIAAATGAASSGQLVVAGSDTAAIDKGGAIVFAGKWDTATNNIAQWAKIAGYKENATNNNYAGYLGFYTRADGGAATERARITSGGDLLVGGIASTGAYEKFLSTTSTYTAITAQNTNASNTYDVILARASRNTTNSTFRAITYYNDGAGEYRFIVQDSGNVENKNNSYGAISDIKLKENITDATPKLEKLQQVRVVNYNLIGETQKQIGVIAQELEQIFPGMVDEAPDRDAEGNDLGTTTKSVKYSVFVPMLIKAIQEQQTIIQSLTARIAALESKGA